MLNNTLEKRRPGLFLLGTIAAMSLTLTAFSWKYEDSRNNLLSPIGEESILIESDLDRIIIERKVPFDRVTKTTKSNSIEVSERARINMKMLDRGKSTLRRISNSNGNKSLDRNIRSSCALEVISYRDIALHEMPYLRICGNLKDENKRFQCTQSEMRKHIADRFNIPDQSKVADLPDRFLVTFIIDEYGKVRGIDSVDEIDLSLIKEVRRVFKSMPEMVPAASSGRRIAVRFEIPIAMQRVGS